MRYEENPLSYVIDAHLALNSACILAIDDLLDGRWNEDVALLEHQVLALVRLGIGIADDGAVLVLVVLQQLGINTLWVVECSVVLNHTDAGGAGAGQIAGGVQTDITEALHNEGLAAPAGSGACEHATWLWKCLSDRESLGLLTNHAHVVGLVDEVLQTVEDAATGGRDASVNAALVDGLASDTSVRIDVQMTDGLGIGIGNPGHLTLASAHIGCGHINAGANETLLGQLKGEATRDLLQLMLRVLLGIDLQAGLGTTEGHINAGALEGHQSRKGFDFIA